MKKRNRSLPIVISVLATVSLIAVGFSTWIFNYEKKTSDFGTQVSCSEAYAQTAVFKVKMAPKEITPVQKQNANKRILKANEAETIDNTIHLGEKIELPAPDDKTFGIYADEGVTDLTITIDATVELSKTYIENIGLPTSIYYAYSSSNLDFFKTTNNKVGRTSETSWTYLNLPEETTMDVNSYKQDILNLNDGEVITTSGGWKLSKQAGKPLYDINKVCTLNFTWGSYFNNEAPVTYYNKLLNDKKTNAGSNGLSKQEIYTYFDNVQSELKTMYDQCNIKQTKENKAALSLIATVRLPN